LFPGESRTGGHPKKSSRNNILLLTLQFNGHFSAEFLMRGAAAFKRAVGFPPTDLDLVPARKFQKTPALEPDVIH
jgi:hypothetical protein